MFFTQLFLRADVDSNGRVEFNDAEHLAAFLAGKEEILCLDAADVDDDNEITAKDYTDLIRYLFKYGLPLAKPFPECGEDPTEDKLGCESFGECL